MSLIYGSPTIDRRTSLGKALDHWRTELIADLGGKDQVSTQELAIIEAALKTKLLLDSIDAWLLQQATLINARKRSVYPVVGQRQQLADALARYMMQLGLKRRAQPACSLGDLLSKDSVGELTGRGEI